LLGHIKKQNGVAVKRIQEFRNFSKEVKAGDVVGPTLFAPGDFVDAIGVTKGRGFEGVVKRHHFAGGDSTHGAKGWHRRSGAIGQRLFPGTVMRGMRMPGHMGQVRRTTQNLQVIQVREAENLLLIKGAIPGAKGDYVVIRESKKRPKGWKPRPSTQMTKREAAKKEAAKK
jgi:large subunit ribosomal protein L3